VHRYNVLRRYGRSQKRPCNPTDFSIKLFSDAIASESTQLVHMARKIDGHILLVVFLPCAREHLADVILNRVARLNACRNDSYAPIDALAAGATMALSRFEETLMGTGTSLRNQAFGSMFPNKTDDLRLGLKEVRVVDDKGPPEEHSVKLRKLLQPEGMCRSRCPRSEYLVSYRQVHADDSVLKEPHSLGTEHCTNRCPQRREEERACALRVFPIQSLGLIDPDRDVKDL
jgi:hypothetical protein